VSRNLDLCGYQGMNPQKGVSLLVRRKKYTYLLFNVSGKTKKLISVTILQTINTSNPGNR
jgi:hypothetical protein